MTHEEQVERALDEVLNAIDGHGIDELALDNEAMRDELRDVLSSVIARAGAEAREAEAEKRGVENFDGPGRW
jgi:hypothetical protein